MTIVDVPADAISERVNRIDTKAWRANVARVLVALLLLPFVLIGRTGGLIVTATLYAVAAIQEGYAMQRPARTDRKAA